jgi:hypothetical protein
MFLKPCHVRLYFLLAASIMLLSSLAYSAAPATMRLDYYHTGNATAEMFGFDRVVIEPLPWPGDLAKTIDDSNLGDYFFEVRDQASGRKPRKRRNSIARSPSRYVFPLPRLQ